MDFEGLLLRKVDLDTDVILAVLDTCLDALRRCFPKQIDELELEDIRSLIRRRIQIGITGQNVFENPLRPKQLIVFARLWGAPCWIVLGEDTAGVRNVITVRMHKERVFGDEFQEVGEDE